MPFSIKCQTPEIENLCKSEKHSLSLVFLEKQIFESESQKDRNGYILEKAYCYKHQNEFQKAAETLKRAYPAASSDSISYLIGYESALCNYLSSDYSKAKLSLIQLKNRFPPNEEKIQILYLEVLIAHEMEQWEEAESKILRSDNFSDNFKDSIKTMYHEMEAIKLKDPAKAETISRFIPGAGQMYAGKFLRGLTSMVIQAGLLGFAGYSFLNGYYFSGTFTGVSLFYVFYMGGARHAEYLAIEYNKEKIAFVKNKIENYLFTHIKKENAI